MVTITSIEMDCPDHLKWYLTQEGRDKMKADIEDITRIIDRAQEIANRYGFDLTADIVERE